jgi:hypothetical protein
VDRNELDGERGAMSKGNYYYPGRHQDGSELMEHALCLKTSRGVEVAADWMESFGIPYDLAINALIGAHPRSQAAAIFIHKTTNGASH